MKAICIGLFGAMAAGAFPGVAFGQGTSSNLGQATLEALMDIRVTSAGRKSQRAEDLTVSDSDRFCQRTGMIELFVEAGRMRFAINVDAVERAHLRLSSRLLGLAKIVRDKHAQ